VSAAASSGSLRRLPARIGQLLVAPRAALARIDAEGGGVRDAWWLVALGAVTFRFPQLVEALLGLTDPSTGSFARVLAVLSNELLPAAWVVIPAALIVTVAAGRHRDAARDLELGAACYAPFFLVRGLGRAADALGGAQTLAPTATEVPAAVAALVLLAFAVQTARRRPPRETVPAQAAAAPPEAQAPSPDAAPAPGPRATVAGLGVLAVALAGLAGNAAWSARHVEALRPMRAGQAAPAFALPRFDGGGEVALADLRGQVVVLDFWATWCPPCLAMMPILDQLHREWAPRGVAFLGVNSDGGGITLDELRAFMQRHPAPYPVVVDDGTANALYRVRSLPQLVVIGRDGTVRHTFLGLVGRDGVSAALREALASGS
jgi:thiol-disulfide isomerase/thioredoxin